MVNKIELAIYGTRGSCATGNKEYMEFGGDTSSYSLKIDDKIHFLDAGSGIRRAMEEGLTPEIKKAYLNISRGHADHLDMGCAGGIYFNKLAEGIQVIGYKAIKDAIPNFFDGNTIWPVPVGGMKGMAPVFNAIGGGELLKYGDYNLSTLSNYHPLTQDPEVGYGGSIGFRFDIMKPENEIVSVAYISDMEFDYMPNGKGGNKVQPEAGRLKDDFVSFVRGADLLLADTHFTREEYEKTMPFVKGWGHSPLEQIIDLANQAGVKTLLGTHHAPQHNDTFLRNQELKAIEYAKANGFAGNFAYARDGNRFTF